MRGKLGGPLRLIRSVRGEGTLLWGASGSRPVSYAFDLYSQGQMRTASGDVRGDLALLVERVPANVRLRLADGAEAPVSLSEIEEDTASIELIEPFPASLT
jgi:hypothetical protein